jgi:hypothetical protein
LILMGTTTGCGRQYTVLVPGECCPAVSVECPAQPMLTQKGAF